MQASYPVPDGNPPLQADPGDPYRVFSDIDIPFGPDCTLTTETQTKAIYVYDADNGSPTNYSVQPRPFDVQVLRYNRQTGAYLGLARLTEVDDTGAGFAQDMSGGAGTLWRPLGLNQTMVHWNFTADKDEIYKFRIYRAYYNNTLQFRLPYDGAYFYRQCKTSLRPVASITPNNAEVGETITAGAKIENVGTTVYPSRVTYTRYIWPDKNRNGARDANEAYMGGMPLTQTVIVPASGGLDLGDRSFVADTGTMGGRVCTSLVLSQASGENVTFSGNPSGPVCVDIGKTPKLHVSTGDVMVGGTFRDATGVCPAQTLSTTSLQLRGSISTIGGGTYSSYTDYGANSLGTISVFGTNGVNPQTPPANNMSFGNDAPLGYFFSPTGNPPSNPTRGRCLNDPFAAFQSKASSPNASTTIDVSNLAANTLATAGGTLTINGTARQLPPGYKRVIYAPNASVVMISSNIVYSEGPYTSTDQLPQLVVLTGGRIIVQDNVTRIDGLYAAKGDFQTCQLWPLLGTCDQHLDINGAVIAGGRVVPFRTSGSESPGYGDKAEEFRLRPDLLLNQLPGPGTQSTIKTVDQREVPPRF
jgi:hypothetical protein